MNLLETLQQKLKELGPIEVAKQLDVPVASIKSFEAGKTKPGLVTCQKMLDIWSDPAPAPAPEQASAPSEAPAASVEQFRAMQDENGAIEVSYCPPEWNEKKELWKGRDVCLCIASYQFFPGECFTCFMALAMKYRQGIRLEHRHSDSMIARSRNQLAKRFLATGATWSIWLDSDMIFPFGNSGIFATQTGMDIPNQFGNLHTIERLISHGKTIVGGCYWDRRGGGRLIAGGSQPILHTIPSDNLAAVDFVGTGCLAVHRQVFIDVAKTFPDTMSSDAPGNETGFFTPIQKGRMLGEDESFAYRAAQSGHPSYLDLGVICGHVGTAIRGLPEKGSKI
jgi:hypothetical protein